jgi:hypothetical protein
LGIWHEKCYNKKDGFFLGDTNYRVMNMKNTFDSWKQFLLKEDVYYKDGDSLKGPIKAEKVASDIIKYIKRNYPNLYQGSDLQFLRGKIVLQFTNFGNLKQRDEVIRDLIEKGWLRDGEEKRMKLYHRAKTKFVDVAEKTKKQRPIEIQLNQGGGPAKSGGSYEDEISMVLNKMFEEYGLEYKARKEGGSTNKPDIIAYETSQMTKPFTSFEAKTILGADFGQFQIEHDPETGTFRQKTQHDSRQLTDIFKMLEEEINKSCPVPKDGESSELLKIYPEQVSGLSKVAEIIEDYYKEKNVDYIIVKDMVYSTGRSPSKLKRFKDAVPEGKGYVRIRRKCHGKSYSTTAALRISQISPSNRIYEEAVFEEIFK